MSDNTKMNGILEPGETIRWSGTPQEYSLFGESHKKATITTLILALAWGIFFIGGYYALTATKNVEIQTGVMLFCAAVPLFVMFMFMSDHRNVKKLLYAVTDKRAIVLSDNPVSLPLADIDAIRVEKADDGNCHIRLGTPAFKTSTRKLPVLACRGEFIGQDDKKTCKGLAFFNVSAADEKILADLLKPSTAQG